MYTFSTLEPPPLSKREGFGTLLLLFVFNWSLIPPQQYIQWISYQLCQEVRISWLLGKRKKRNLKQKKHVVHKTPQLENTIHW